MAEDVEYGSDPEELKLSLKMRRRVASDDEDEEVEEMRKEKAGVDSDGEGGAVDYVCDEDEDEDEEEEDIEEEVFFKGDGEVAGTYREGGESVDGENDGGNEWGDDGVGNRKEGEKKEQEPYAVPTAGAFYMHDDRFQDNVGGRHRRMLGGRILWESKDERKWGHDKFEELTMHNRPYDEGRRSARGRNRGRGGRSRGAPQGYSPLSTPNSYDNNKYQVTDIIKYQVTDNIKYQVNDNNQNAVPRSVKGRGPRRYQPSAKANNNAPAQQNKQYRKSQPSQSGRANMRTSNSDPIHVPAKKQSGSSLNYASPPFYPSSSLNTEVNLTQMEDAQGGPASRNIQTPVVNQDFTRPQSKSVVQGKSSMGSVGMDKLYIDNSTSASADLKFAPSGTRLNNSSQPQKFRGNGRGPNSVPQTSHQPAAMSNLVNKFSSPTHPGQRNSAQSQNPTPIQASSHQFVQRSSTVSQSSSPPKAVVPVNSPEAGELEFDSQLESSKSKVSFIGKGNANMQGGGRVSCIYGGRQVMGSSGNMITGHGDKNLPTFLPVMQLGGQRPGGMGVPAVGMAFPGYVGNPQLGNSEMTWLPVLAGAAGALGATYCPPYFSVDGAYHDRPSAQLSVPSNAPSKEVSNNSSNDELKASQRPELVNDDFGQRQKNLRRYTEMKFDQ